MTRNMRNIIITILIAVVALAAAIKGYVHHQFKTNIDNTLSSMQLFAQVKYSSLSTSLISGEVKLENVRVSSTFLPADVNLGTLIFETPGLIFMLKGPESFKSGEFPDHLGFAINDFILDLNGELAQWLDKLVNRLQVVYASERKICGGKSLFGPADYIQMAYTRLSSNMHINYNFNKNNQSLDININASTRNFASIRAKINITKIGGMSPGGMMQAGMPHLENVEVIYKDETYTSRMLKYCSKLSNMKKEQFVEAEVKQSDNYFNMLWGFAPGKGLREAYKDFLLKPDEVVLSMHPGKEFNPIMAQTMSAEEIMEGLNVHLKINGLLVTDLSFKLPGPKFTAKHQQRLARAINFESLLRGESLITDKPIEPVTPPKIIKKETKYHPISLAEIPQHITDFVNITTKNGNTRKGQLIRMDKTNLYVQKKVSGGKFTMTVPREKIKKIEAYFSK